MQNPRYCDRCEKTSPGAMFSSEHTGAARKHSGTRYAGASLTKPLGRPAMITDRQRVYLDRLVRADFSLATTHGLARLDLRALTKKAASDAIDAMLAV